MTTKRAVIRNAFMNVKIVAVIISILILLLSFSVNAQHNTDSSSYAKKAQRALATKRFGAGLTLLSTAAFIAGGIITSNGNDDGVGIAMGAMAGTVIGIPIWLIGGANHRKFTRKAQGITIRVKATPRQSGLTLTYRF